MATYSTTILGSIRAFQMEHGLKVAHVRITSQASTDYVVGSGVPIQSVSNRFGMARVFAVLGVTLRTAANVIKPELAYYDHVTGGLRFYEATVGTLAGDTITTSDEIEAADFPSGNIIDCLIVGV